MRIISFRLLIFLFWIVMMGWLIRFEAFPYWFTREAGGYRDLFRDRPFILDSWMQITFEGLPIGYTHTWMDSDIRPNSESHSILNKTVLCLNLMGSSQTINVLSRIVLDESYAMRNFSTALHSEFYTTSVEGNRIEGNRFEVSVRTHSGSSNTEIEIPDDCLIYSPMNEMAVRGLKPGEHLRLRVFDPVSMSVSEVIVEALRTEEIEHEARVVDATALKISCMGLDMLSWVDSNGRALRHETPFGWVLTACSAEEILAPISGIKDGVDMLSAMAVPCKGEVVNPRNLRQMTVKFTGIPFNAESLASPRQFVEQLADGVKMTVLAQRPPSHVSTLGAPAPEECLPFLQPSASIQSDHPDIIKTARAITGNSADAFEAAQAISAWIQNNVQMQPTFSVPSAPDVLTTLVGDCNEITHLFVALARAAGIPARVHAGLIYDSTGGPGAFYYHSWPSVYVGEWVEMDPVWGQGTVDATHVSLVTGELVELLKLAKMLGRARAELLPEEYKP